MYDRCMIHPSRHLSPTFDSKDSDAAVRSQSVGFCAKEQGGRLVYISASCMALKVVHACHNKTTVAGYSHVSLVPLCVWDVDRIYAEMSK